VAGQIIQTNRLIPGAGSLLRSTAVLILAGVALQAPHARAQNLEPRAYTNAPVGMNFLIGGFLYTKGNIAVDPSVPLTDARLQTRSAVVAYAHAFDIGGQSAKFDVIVPYTALEGSALFAGAPVAREVTGFGDPALRVSVNFLGAPALPAQGFNGYQQDLIVGASVQVSAPWGQYDPARLVNLGTNRWAARAELGVSKARGAWILELAPGITWFADNDEFLGGKRREQAPVYSLQAHLVHSLPGGIWVSHHRGRRAEQRPADEYAPRLHRRAARGSLQLDQALRQHRRFDSHRRHLRCRGRCVAASMGRRILSMHIGPIPRLAGVRLPSRREPAPAMTRRSLVKSFAKFIIVLIALWTTAAAAQGKPAADKPADSMQALRQQLLVDKKAVVTANLSLTQAEAKAFWPLYEEYQKGLARVNDGLATLIVAYAREYNADTLTDEKARKLLDSYFGVEDAEVKLRRSFVPRFAKVLPGRKLARYMQMENKMRILVKYEIASEVPLAQ
jgi:hypothetical protein